MDEVARLREEIRGGLNVTDEELLRQRNYCEYAGDGKIEVWAVFLQRLIDHIRELRQIDKEAAGEAKTLPEPPVPDDTTKALQPHPERFGGGSEP